MIECMFHVSGGSPPCLALQALGARALSPKEISALERNYCLAGTILCCPVLARVQACLRERWGDVERRQALQEAQAAAG